MNVMVARYMDSMNKRLCLCFSILLLFGCAKEGRNVSYEYEEGDIDATDEETAEEIAKILKGEELIVKPLIGSGYVHSDMENPIVVEDEEGYNVVEASKESGNLEWYGVNITKVVLDASDLVDRVNAAYDSYSDQEEDLEGIRGENLGESNIRESFDSFDFDIETAILNTELASRFLGRWVSDCEYILGACQDAIKSFPDTNPKGALKHLWANDIDEQIRLMKKAKSTLDKAKIPTTVTYKDIDMYSKKLHELEGLKENKKPTRSGRRFNKSNEHPYIKMPSNTKNLMTGTGNIGICGMKQIRNCSHPMTLMKIMTTMK